MADELIRCAALGCSNDSTSSDVAFFFLPSEPKLKTLWETNVGRNDLPVSSVICEIHFSLNDIVDEDEGKTLKYDAVPSMFGRKPDDDNVRRSARKKTIKKQGSRIVPVSRSTRRMLVKGKITAPAPRPSLGKINEGNSARPNDEPSVPPRGQQTSSEILKPSKRKKDARGETETVSSKESATKASVCPKGPVGKSKPTKRKRPIGKDPLETETESTNIRPDQSCLNATDERGDAIAEWYLLDVFEATKMITSSLKTGTSITDSLVANVEETIIDVISKLLQRISSVIITSLEEEFGFRTDIKKILSKLDENIVDDVEKMLRFDHEDNHAPEMSREKSEENYSELLKRMDPTNPENQDQAILEEVISPVDDDYSVLTEHAYFREERPPKGKKALRENRSAQVLHCGFCKFKSKIKSKLRRHMRKHLTIKVYNCPLCGYSTKSEESLQKHYRTHSGAKPYACTECDFKTANRSNLTRHMMIHSGVKPFQCPHCDHATRQKSSLESHIKSHDAFPEPSIYACGEAQCCFVTINKAEFSSHVRRHKVYDCAHCEYTTKSYKELKEHQAIHRGMKHECRTCEKICHSAEELRTHLETHKSPIEYVCQFCGYRTNKCAYYNRHLNCHSGERPYKCEYCSHTFRMNAHLMAHVRRHEIGPFCKKSSM